MTTLLKNKPMNMLLNLKDEEISIENVVIDFQGTRQDNQRVKDIISKMPQR